MKRLDERAFRGKYQHIVDWPLDYLYIMYAEIMDEMRELEERVEYLENKEKVLK